MILGAILAGGRSTRFGSDKAEAIWQQRPLVEHVINHLATVCSAVIICGRDREGVTSVCDRPAPDLGPLGGLNAALHYAEKHGFDRVICAPCDAPILPERLLRALIAEQGSAYLWNMPVVGIWASSCAAMLDTYLQSGQKRSVRRWAELVSARPLELDTPHNVNEPADLEALDGHG